MNKGQLVECVAKNAELTSKQAHEAVNAIFDTIKQTLAKGEDVTPVPRKPSRSLPARFPLSRQAPL